MNSDKIDVELWNLNIPLAPPIKSIKGLTTQTHVLLCMVKDSKNNRGIGYSSFKQHADLEQAASSAQGLIDAAGPYLPALLDIERTEERNGVGTEKARKFAANALSLAAWDLAGQQRGVACADLWGRYPGRDAIDCYASALWLDKTLPELIAEAKDHKAANYRYVKMRVGRSLGENLDRIAAVQTIYTEPRTIALETGLGWNVEITNEFLREAPGEYLWIEDPVSYDLIGTIDRSERNKICAGEICTSTSALVELFSNGKVRLMPLDVQYLGGPIRFLEAARLLHALGVTVGAHRFSHYSIHLLACLPKSLPVEMLDWTNPSLVPLSSPDKVGKLSVRGPGFAISVDQTVIDRCGRKIN